MECLETLAFGAVEDILVMVHLTPRPSVIDWERMMCFFDSQQQIEALVVFAFGASINARQRENMSDHAKRHGYRMVVLTDSRIVRGLLVAVAWLGVEIRAFAPDDIGGALRHLERAGLEHAFMAEVGEALRRAGGTKFGRS